MPSVQQRRRQAPVPQSRCVCLMASRSVVQCVFCRPRYACEQCRRCEFEIAWVEDVWRSCANSDTCSRNPGNRSDGLGSASSFGGSKACALWHNYPRRSLPKRPDRAFKPMRWFIPALTWKGGKTILPTGSISEMLLRRGLGRCSSSWRLQLPSG